MTPTTPKLPGNMTHADLACILNVLRNRSMLGNDMLFTAVKSHVDDDREKFDKIVAFLEKIRYIALHEHAWRMSALGDTWLNEQGSGLTVEEEDVGNDEAPTKPYEVGKLKTESRTLSVYHVLRMIKKYNKKEPGGINLNPEFQRAFVWDQQKQSRLIESILIRIPLPAFYIDATNSEEWNVVDGLQRLTTLFRYCRDESFALSGLQFFTELTGMKFSELPAQYRLLIEDDTELQFYNLMPGTPAAAKFTIFSRVNTGGMQLTAQEIRHALNQGPITETLHRLANHSLFKTITDGAVESLRMSDREVILRALAFMYMGVEAYKQYNGQDEFLLAAMEQMNRFPKKLEKIETEFLRSLEKVHLIFGRYAFRKFFERGGRRSPFNKALFEVWTVCVRNVDRVALLAHADKIVDLFIQKMNQPSAPLLGAISASTGKFSAVSARFAETEKILKEAPSD